VRTLVYPIPKKSELEKMEVRLWEPTQPLEFFCCMLLSYFYVDSKRNSWQAQYNTPSLRIYLGVVQWGNRRGKKRKKDTSQETTLGSHRIKERNLL